jgi:hypothetical protein
MMTMEIFITDQMRKGIVVTAVCCNLLCCAIHGNDSLDEAMQPVMILLSSLQLALTMIVLQSIGSIQDLFL